MVVPTDVVLQQSSSFLSSSCPLPSSLPVGSHRAVLIDFAQSVTVDHPNAQSFLRRDVRQVTDFFGRFAAVLTEELLYEWIEGGAGGGDDQEEGEEEEGYEWVGREEEGEGGQIRNLFQTPIFYSNKTIVRIFFKCSFLQCVVLSINNLNSSIKRSLRPRLSPLVVECNVEFSQQLLDAHAYVPR